MSDPHGADRLFVTDTIEASLRFVDGDDRVELTDDFSLDEQTTVQIENQQWVDAFGTDTYYRFEPVVARPIDQTYELYGDEYVFRKDADELRSAQWQIDNLPWTLGHPQGGQVRDTDDIHGFWRNPTYVDGDGQRAQLYVPEDDNEALGFVMDNADLSIGFGCTLDWLDEDDDVDAVQRDMLFDHIASVQHGRCSADDGCGLETLGDGARFDGHAVGGCTTGECSCDLHADAVASSRSSGGDAPSGIYTTGGQWFAVGPDDHTKDSTRHPDDAMFPVGSCESVEDAWTLRNHAEDLTIEQSTLEARIKRAGGAQDCSGMPWEDSVTVTDDDRVDAAQRYAIGYDITETMSDSDTPDEDNDSMFTLDDMKADAVVDEHDGVAELIDQKEATIQSLTDEKSDLESEVEDLRSFKDAVEHERRKELVDEITDITDYWDADEMLGDADDADPTDVDVLEERLEALSDAAATETTPAGESGGGDEPEPDEGDGGIELTDKGTVDLRQSAD